MAAVFTRAGVGEGPCAEPLLLSCANAPIAHSLLFAYAMRRALAGDSVLFVCPSRERIAQASFAQPAPLGSQANDDERRQTEAALSRIQMKYVATDLALRQLLASAHLVGPPVPSVLIIADFHEFFARPASLPPAEHHAEHAPNVDQAHAAQGLVDRTLALALNATEHFTRGRFGGKEQPRECSLIVSVVETSASSPGSAERAARTYCFKRQLRVHGPLAHEGTAAHVGRYAVADSFFPGLVHVRLEPGTDWRRGDLILAIEGTGTPGCGTADEAAGSPRYDSGQRAAHGERDAHYSPPIVPAATAPHAPTGQV
jgi:hypothetical protein